ncbi:hypothetical protein niasHT_020057 [Heterodera trifolii]|uniref:BZIP domain-containing protein n=2 Tax=Heterodera trifolii TaxID=157864 RepID=A0ABD2LJP0_9BILA
MNNNNGKNSNNCDSAGQARRSRKRNRADLLHEVDMDKIREEKRRRRQRRKNEEVQRQRAFLRLRTDYRNARCAVATGQYRMSCTGTTTFVAIPQIGQSHGQPAMPFTLAFSYEPALPIGAPADLFGQSFVGTAPSPAPNSWCKCRVSKQMFPNVETRPN